MAKERELSEKEHAIKLWDGFDPHPVVIAIERRLTQMGFVKIYGGADHDGSYHRNHHWAKPAFAEIDHFIDITPGLSDRGSVEFSVRIGGTSRQYQDAENTVKAWECDPEHNALFPGKPYLYPERMVQVSLHWLMLNAEPPVRQLRWSATAENAEASADMWLNDFCQYGIPFLKKIDTREKLIHLLQNIDAYPHKTPARGPGSPEPSLCAALLLYLAGDVDAAIQELEVGYRVDVARAGRTWAGNEKAIQDAIRVRKCKIDRYRHFFESKGPG